MKKRRTSDAAFSVNSANRFQQFQNFKNVEKDAVSFIFITTTENWSVEQNHMCNKCC